MISEDPKYMKTRAPAELCGEINLPRSVCYSLVNRHAGSKITALCKQQRVCLVSSKQNRQIWVSVEVYLSPLWISHPSLHSQENGGSWQWAELLQTPSPWTELKIHPQGTKIAFCTFCSSFMAIKKKNPCISRSISLHYALRKALLKDQFYSWNWKTGWRTITLSKALLQNKELDLAKPQIPKIMNRPENPSPPPFCTSKESCTELYGLECTVLAHSTALWEAQLPVLHKHTK